MIASNYLVTLPSPLKSLIGVFLVVLSIGFLSGLTFVNETTEGTSSGIIENYNGNEENEEAKEMKFRKSDHEILNIIHTHILSMSIIFFILGFLVHGTEADHKLKYFLMIEPLISVLVTFGGIYLIWLGWEWMTYVVMVSGGLMTLSFVGSVVLIYRSIIS